MNGFEACFQSMGISIEPMTDQASKGFTKRASVFDLLPFCCQEIRKINQYFFIAFAID